MIQGVKYFNNDIGYLKEPHFCPYCKTKLKTVKVSKVVNPKSPEAKDFDFSLGSAPNKIWLTGNTKFIWKEFECPNCKKHITVKEMKEIEGFTESEKIGNGIGGKIAFGICGIILIIIMALIKNIFSFR